MEYNKARHPFFSSLQKHFTFDFIELPCTDMTLPQLEQAPVEETKKLKYIKLQNKMSVHVPPIILR